MADKTTATDTQGAFDAEHAPVEPDEVREPTPVSRGEEKPLPKPAGGTYNAFVPTSSL